MSVFRGQAAFTWTDTDDTMTQRVLLLREPVRELRPAHTQSVYVADSLDKRTRQTFTVGEGVDELVVRVRFGDDPQGVIDLVKAGSKQRTITYVPDLRDPAVTYPCLLVSPVSPTQLGLDPDSGVTFGDQDVELRLRHTESLPFAAVFGNPVLFSFRAGGRIEEGTFSRAGVASYAANSDARGTLTTAAAGAARLSWASTNSSAPVGRRIPTLLLEEQRTNLLKQSENLGASSAWVRSSTIGFVFTSGQTDPRGGANGWLLEDNNLAIRTIRQTFTITSSTRLAASIFLRPTTTNPTSRLDIFTTSSGVGGITFTVTWSSGIPTMSQTAGATAFQRVTAWRGGWYRFSACTTGTKSTGNYLFKFTPHTGGGNAGIYAFGAQAETV